MTFAKQNAFKNIYIMVIAIMFVASIAYTASTAHAEWKAAYQVAYTHTEPWYEPHYGAWFYGAYGQPGSGVFYGPSGSYAGYASNNWWGNNLNVELVSKSWLFSPTCWTFLTGWNICGDRWQGYYHHADLFQ